MFFNVFFLIKLDLVHSKREGSKWLSLPNMTPLSVKTNDNLNFLHCYIKCYLKNSFKRREIFFLDKTFLFLFLSLEKKVIVPGRFKCFQKKFKTIDSNRVNFSLINHLTLMRCRTLSRVINVHP